ncbi:MAG: acyl-CoA dehydrogenase family protein [Firmicutes bacterium]|nr:acyl-CoA dehydrogenase family protein [Bacillota bacterium]
MTYKLSDLGSDILSDIKTFCERDLRAQAAEADRTRQGVEELYEATGRMGLGVLFVPEANGGLDLTPEDRAAILEELAYCDAGVAVSYMANCLATVPLKMYAPDDLMDSCCRMMLEGKFGAFCLTEDQAGSDIDGILTRAEHIDGEYVVNGTKAFVTNGNAAGFYIVFAKTDNGLSAFCVDADTEGITAGEDERKLGIRNSRTCEVSFTDVKVPEDRLLGAEGEGKKVAASALDRARAFCAAAATGVARRSLDLAAARAEERILFGKPLAHLENVQIKLGEMREKIGAAGLSCVQALELIREGKDCRAASAYAKCLAADTAVFCADSALQIYGGCGYCEDYPVEKLFRDARIFRISEGANEVLLEMIGRGTDRPRA